MDSSREAVEGYCSVQEQAQISRQISRPVHPTPASAVPPPCSPHPSYARTRTHPPKGLLNLHPDLVDPKHEEGKDARQQHREPGVGSPQREGQQDEPHQPVVEGRFEEWVG